MRELVFSSRSKTEIKAIVDYLIDKWSVRISDKFLDTLKVNLDLIQKSPELFQNQKVVITINASSSNKLLFFIVLITRKFTLYPCLILDKILKR